MTLIITALSENIVVQVSDRRLTYPNGSCSDNWAIKAICVSCADACFSMAYTGLAEIRSQRTDEWAVDYLASIKANELNFPELFKSFRKHVVSTFRKLCHLGTTRGITFVIAGFGRPGPFMALLSNIEDGRGNRLTNIDDNFQTRFYFRNDKPLRKLDIMINGAEGTIEAFGTAIPRIRKRYLRKNPGEIATVFVQLVRKAAGHLKYGHLVGKNCMSTVVNPTGDFLCQDYPEKSSPQRYMPHLISHSGIYKDIRIWTGEDTPPWWTEDKD
jgi:hypothetical protein